jgi:hypothetical protein
MLIHQDPEAVALGWVLFSHDPIIQELSSLLLTKKPDGFTQIKNDRLIAIMAPYWRGPKGFVVWKQETVHYENVMASSLNRFSYRAVVGTHNPIGLTSEMRRQLAYLAEQGWCPNIYTKQQPHNVGTQVNMNVVDRKVSKDGTPRVMTSVETLNLKNLDYTPDGIEKCLMALPSIIREFYGIV